MRMKFNQGVTSCLVFGYFSVYLGNFHYQTLWLLNLVLNTVFESKYALQQFSAGKDSWKRKNVINQMFNSVYKWEFRSDTQGGSGGNHLRCPWSLPWCSWNAQTEIYNVLIKVPLLHTEEKNALWPCPFKNKAPGLGVCKISKNLQNKLLETLQGCQ